MKNYALGDVIEGTVERVTPFGAFIDVGEDIEALLHVSELPEDYGPYPNIEEELPEGTNGQFKVIGVWPELGRIGLSMHDLPRGHI